MSDVVDTRRFGSELARHNALKYKDHSTSDFLLTDAASKWWIRCGASLTMLRSIAGPDASI
jgi:hypothetical protein